MIVATALPAGCLLAGNLLPNGSFEVGRYGWYVHSQMCRGSRMQVVQTGAKCGSHCATVTRTAEVGTTFLMHEYIRLEEDKDHVFSVWLRSGSDALPVTLRLCCLDANQNGKWHEASQRVSVGRRWRQYHLRWRTPAARMSMYLPRVDIESPGMMYVDGAQIEQGDVTDFAPAAPIELGLSPEGDDSLYLPREPVRLRVLAANSGNTNRDLRVRVTLTDYTEQRVAEKTASLVAPARKTSVSSFDLSQKRLGYYRAEVTLLDESGSEIGQGRWAFAVIPEPSVRPDVKFGICMERENLDTDVPLARAIGMGSARLHNNMLWANIEKEKGKFDWRWEEAAVHAVREAGLEPLAIVDTVPAWAWDPERNRLRDVSNWANMVEAMVGTWKGSIRDWEIINEPVARYLPEVYFPLLREGYLAAKRTDPRCNVVGICGFHNDDKLIPYVLEHGGLEYMDVFSVHPYATFGQTPERGLPPIWEWVRALMRTYGRGKPIWSTEFGWRATDWPLTPDGEGAVIDLPDEKAQADYAVRTEVISFAHGVERFYYFLLATHLYSGTYTNSLFAGDSLASPKKVVSALAGLTRRLSGLSACGRWDCGSDNLGGYRFADSQRQVIVLWAPLSPNTLLVTAKRDALRLYDVAGNETPPQAEAGMLKVALSATPMYIEARAHLEIAPRTILSLSPLEEIDPEQSRSATIIATIENPLKRPIRGQITVSLPKGWQTDPPSIAVHANPGQHQEAAFSITPSPGYADATARSRFELRDAASDQVLASADRVAKFRLGPPPKPRHTIWVEAESATEKDPNFNVLKADCAYGGLFLHIEAAVKPASGLGYLSAKIPFRCQQRGKYLLMMFGNPLNVVYMSPFWWRIDQGEWHRAWDLPQQGVIWSPWPQTGNQYRFFGRTDLGRVDLTEGDRCLQLRIDEHRQIDACYTIFADAFAFLKEG